MSAPVQAALVSTLDALVEQLVPASEMKPEWKETVVTGLTVDSRKVKQGNCFIAYPGHHSDGRDYLSAAFSAGASCALVEADSAATTQAFAVPMVFVSDLQSKLGTVANAFYQSPSSKLKVLAVTGTNGKTSVTQLVAGAIAAMGEKAGVIGTLGNGLVGQLQETDNTTPDVVEANGQLKSMLDAGAGFVAMETSSHGLVQGRVDGINIHTGLVTNISRDHLDYHGTMEAYRDAKALLAKNEGLTNLILNADDDMVISMDRFAQPGVKVWPFSQRHQPGVSVSARAIDFHGKGIRMDVEFDGQVSQIKSRLIGEFNASNLLAALTSLLALGFDLNASCQALSQAESVPGRMQRVETPSFMASVVVDFAHTPDALEKALLALRKHCEGKLWCVFGCGGNRDAGKRPQMAEVAGRLADEVLLTADNPRNEKLADIFQHMIKGIPQGVAFQVIDDRAQAIQFALKNASSNDVVLLAGKGHETYQEVNGVKRPYSDLFAAQSVIAQISEQVEG